MSVIDDIRREREDLARVLKKHVGIRKIVEELYPDSAHFIYELLQNAEDAGATEAKFSLSSNSLSFTHNGRPFNRQDIKAITDIGEGTKAGDADTIGRFGVGFKAVFAYTESPRIWSTDFSFEIRELVLPYALPADPLLKADTRFAFPFDNPKKTAAVAYEETATGLRALTAATLLFLKNLEAICWQINEGETCQILRVPHTEHQLEIIRETNADSPTSQHFLLFEEPVTDLGQQRVALAFDLEPLYQGAAYDSGKPLCEQCRIVPANPGAVAIFFLAEKETSGLRFHLHAPFVPELSRASVKDTPANLPLFEQLAALAAASLHEIKAMGFLTGEFLAVLPNQKDHLSERYSCIHSAIVTEMNEQPLTPTFAKGHAPARRLADSGAKMKRLFKPVDINFFLRQSDHFLDWVVSPTQRNSDGERFLSGLAITRVTIETLATGLSRSSLKDQTHWLSAKDVSWLQRLYALLGAAMPKDYSRNRVLDLLKQAPIVRRKDGTYGRGDQCFFVGTPDSGDDGFAAIEPRLYTSGEDKEEQNAAKKMLEELGVREVTEWDRVTAILRQRYTSRAPSPNLADLERFVAVVEKDSTRSKTFASYFIFKLQDGKWGKPSQAFLDAPFLDTGLSQYYHARAIDGGPLALASDYEECGVPRKRLSEFAKAVGVITKLQITETTCKGNPNKSHLHSAPGRWLTEYLKDTDYLMVGLEKAVGAQSEAISRLIWRTMCELPSYPNCLEAYYCKNRSNDGRHAASQLVHQLRSLSWVPQGGDVFVQPKHACREKLPSGFTFDAGWPWITAIEFGAALQAQDASMRDKFKAAESLGFASIDEASLWLKVKEAGVDPATLLELLQKAKRPSQPSEAVQNPARRRRNVLESQTDAPSKESALREQQVQLGIREVTARAKAYLRAKYTSEGELVCQCCQDTMPFKLPSSGEYYFEAVQCIEDQEDRHFQNRLALCPTCAAMYQYARESADPEVRDRIVNNDTEESAPAVFVTVRLAGADRDIRFVGTHWFDLKTLLDQDDE